jgi:hypothetical protein
MSQIPLDEALTSLSCTDPTFMPEIRKLLQPVRDRFFTPPALSSLNDGLLTPPPYMTEPDLRRVAIELAEFALKRGIDVNLACTGDGGTFLHGCVLLRDPAIALESVRWLLEHAADPNRQRTDGETPMSLAVKSSRTEVAELMRTHGGR